MVQAHGQGVLLLFLPEALTVWSLTALVLQTGLNSTNNLDKPSHYTINTFRIN
jgi:hypothetical protein